MGNQDMTDRLFKMLSGEDGLIFNDKILMAVRCLGYVVEDNTVFCDTGVNYEEFNKIISELPGHPKIFTKEQIRAAFKCIDINETGYITANELIKVINKSNNKISSDDMKSFFLDFPADLHGNIYYEYLIDSLALYDNQS